MLKKDRTKPITLKILEAAFRRLSENHPGYPKLKNQINIKNAGLYGEQTLDYYLKVVEATGLVTDFQILHDIRLPLKDIHFQIDTLLLFPSFFLILEVKNYKGELTFDPDHSQLIQQTEEKKVVLPDPIIQVRRQLSQLQAWLKLNKLPSISGECAVVLSNSNALVKVLSNPSLVRNYVVKNQAVPSKIEGYLKKRVNPSWNKNTLRKATSKIIKQDTPLTTISLQKYGILKDDILTGVHCSNCEKLGIERINGRWRCPFCLTISKDAHVAAVYDYFLLFGPLISNKEFRRFLHIENADNARNLLKSMKLEQIGNTTAKVYRLPF